MDKLIDSLFELLKKRRELRRTEMEYELNKLFKELEQLEQDTRIFENLLKSKQ